MKIIRTTLCIPSQLKKAAKTMALTRGTTFQEVFTEALKEYVSKKAKNKARTIVFKTHDLGVPLDNLTRTDYYATIINPFKKA